MGQEVYHMYEGVLVVRLTGFTNPDTCIFAAIFPYDASVDAFVSTPMSVAELIQVAVDRGRYFRARANG